MNHIRVQDLREAFTNIITMMLGLLRAHGLRGLLYLPAAWQLDRELRSIADEFCQLFATWQAGALTPSAPAHPSATPRVRARPTAARRNPRAPNLRTHAFSRVQAPYRDPSPPLRAPIPFHVVRAPLPQKNPVFAALPFHVHFVTIS